MQVLVQAVMVGAMRRQGKADDQGNRKSYGEVYVALDQSVPESDRAGQCVQTFRLGDVRIVDAMRHKKLPAPVLLVCDQRTYRGTDGDQTTTIVLDVREPIQLAPVSVAPAAAAGGR